MKTVRSHRLAVLLLLVCVQLAGCSLLRRKPEEKPGPVGQATLIGMIEMVNPEQNYVVIRCDTPPAIQPGTELIAVSSLGTRSRLVLSPERKGYYLTADIKEGSPSVANLVLLPHAATPPEPAPSQPRPAPEAPPTNNDSNSGPASAVPSTPLPSLQPQTPPSGAIPPAAPTAAGLDDLVPPVGNP
jgi:hypothetical protein